jgi:uncharacterized protein YciI
MKHFLIEITYTAPWSQVEPVVPLHRAHLGKGYTDGWLLFSGPMEPRTGGIIIARAPAVQNLQDFFAGDPFQLQGIASYRFVEFTPRLMQPWMKAWVEGDSG